MSQAASQAAAFYREVAVAERLWTIRDAGGFPAPENGDGTRSHPFWSSKSRVEKIISTVSAYSGFEPFEVSLDDFASRWVPGMTRDGLMVGVNWSGVRALGYDVLPASVLEGIEAQRIGGTQ
jgi:hypothetical protein